DAAGRLVPGRDVGLQGAPHDPLRGRAPEDGLRQDPQAGAPRAGTGPGGAHLTGGRPSSTSRTRRTRASDENGFFRRAVSRSATTLRCIMLSSTYPDV